MRSICGVVLVVAVLAAACSGDAPAGPAGGGLFTAASASRTVFVANMSGAQEVPPADPDGTGRGLFQLDEAASTVCWKLSWQNIDPPTAAHIHRGPAGVNGPIVVPLSPIAGGCTPASQALIQEIRKNPGEFYSNVHNSTYPGGAIRGQLTAP